MLLSKNTAVNPTTSEEEVAEPQKWSWQDILRSSHEKWEDKFNTLMTHFPITVWTADSMHNFTFISQNVEKILGISQADIYAGGSIFWESIIHPDDRDTVLKNYRALFTEGVPYDIEYRIKNNSGTWIWVHDRAHDTYVRKDTQLTDGITTNITKRRNFEEELKKVTRELSTAKIKLEQDNAYDEALLGSIGDGVIVIDKSGKTLFINEQTESLLGFSATEIIGKNWSDVVPQAKDKDGNILPIEKRAIYLAISSRKKVNDSYYLVKKDKTTIPVAITAAPVLIKDDLIGSIVVFRDITRETEIDRMKTDFLSIAAHQLRTPLGNTRWNLEMLLAADFGEMRDSQKAVLEQVYTSNQRIIALVNDLLNVSRIEQRRVQNIPELTDIHDIINGAIKEISELSSQKSVIVELRTDTNIPKIMIDQKRFREVIQNLLSNAVKYSYPNSKVTIMSELVNKHITLSVADTGIGIPQKDNAQIFSKFFRAENAVLKGTEGTGLGLFVVKAFVEDWDGRVWFESLEGKGTTFYVEIPVKTKV